LHGLNPTSKRKHCMITNTATLTTCAIYNPLINQLDLRRPNTISTA